MLDVNSFDESKIDWKPLPGPDGEPADHILLSILNVDDKAKIVDVLSVSYTHLTLPTILRV